MTVEDRDDLAGVLTEAMSRDGDLYQDAVFDGAAFEQLARSEPFERYQRGLARAVIGVVQKIRTAKREDLERLQGALQQALLIYEMPRQVIAVAEQALRQRREGE